MPDSSFRFPLVCNAFLPKLTSDAIAACWAVIAHTFIQSGAGLVNCVTIGNTGCRYWTPSHWLAKHASPCPSATVEVDPLGTDNLFPLFSGLPCLEPAVWVM